jgi:hypothetical protein
MGTSISTSRTNGNTTLATKPTTTIPDTPALACVIWLRTSPLG